MRYHVGTKRSCKALQAKDDYDSGIPAKGVHIGGGRHVDMTDDQSSPGWTRHKHEIRRHPFRSRFAYPQKDGSDLSIDWMAG